MCFMRIMNRFLTSFPFSAPFRRSHDKGSVLLGDPALKSPQTGATLIEVLVAATVLITALAANYGVLANSRIIVSAGNDAAVAQQNTMTRIDQMRQLGWSKVTNPVEIATLLAIRPASTTGNLALTREVITVSRINIPALPTTNAQTVPLATTTANGPVLFTVTRAGTAAAVSNPATVVVATIQGERSLNIRARTEWTSRGRTLEREISTVISRSGAR